MLNVAGDIAGRELRFSRLLNAPIQVVWDVWSDPDHIKHWWGPDGFRNTVTEMDLRPGGQWNLVMHGPDGRDYDVKCIFLEVVKCKRIVYEQLMPFKYLAKIEFERRQKKTFIDWTMLFENRDYLIQTARTFGVEEGLRQNAERLVKYLYRFTFTEDEQDQSL